MDTARSARRQRPALRIGRIKRPADGVEGSKPLGTASVSGRRVPRRREKGLTTHISVAAFGLLSRPFLQIRTFLGPTSDSERFGAFAASFARSTLAARPVSMATRPIGSLPQSEAPIRSWLIRLLPYSFATGSRGLPWPQERRIPCLFSPMLSARRSTRSSDVGDPR